MTDLEFTDRYDALSLSLPDPRTVCPGPCEGTGVVPVKAVDETDLYYINQWNQAEARHPSDDGWHFVICKDCQGTGLRNG